MPRKIVAGNWKMNLNADEALQLINDIDQLDIPNDVEVMTFVPSLYVQTAVEESKKATVGVQNFFYEASGAFTGEISIDQIKSLGANIGLIGHSERRSLFGETHEVLKKKVDAAVAGQFDFIFCCGEPLEERESGNHENFVKQQLIDSLFHLNSEQINGGIIAYEPVWAIGTGKTASTEQAEEMHAAIRSWLKEKYDEATADSISILYGGSCKPSNAAELFACPNVDGGLIGGASLEADSFGEIINAY